MRPTAIFVDVIFNDLSISLAFLISSWDLATDPKDDKVNDQDNQGDDPSENGDECSDEASNPASNCAESGDERQPASNGMQDESVGKAICSGSTNTAETRTVNL
jgi:hypothetical protein